MRAAPDFTKYRCSDYIGSKYSQTGFYSKDEQYWTIEPVANAEELLDFNGEPACFLKIGGPGVDGIAFGYREGVEGLWAYYPAEGTFRKMADTLAELIEGWTTGRLSV